MKFLTILGIFFPPKNRFSVGDIPDLTGKVAIVTGANTGVGKEIAKALLTHNAKVYIAARSQEKAEQAISDLKQQTGKEGIWLHLDLSDLKNINVSAEEFLSKEKDLHILINNAGVLSPPIDELTVQGYDLQFGINVLGHVHFTKQLLPALISGAKSSSDGKARVVTLSSVGAYFSPSLDLDLAGDTDKRKKTSPMTLYVHSKLGNILFSNELAKRYGDQGIISSAAHPGAIKSDLYRNRSWIESLSMKLVLHPVSHGALTPLWAATSAEGLDLNGKLLIPWARVATDPPSTVNDEDAAKLWNWCEEQVAKI